MIDVNCNADNFWGMIQAMKPSERKRVMKSAMRRSATMLKDRAAEILLSRLSSVRNRSAMKKTIWTKVYDRTAGFRVSVAGNSHLYPSRMRTKTGGMRALPLGRWLEEGTKNRATSKGYARGSLPALKFMRQAKEGKEPKISEDLENNFMMEMQRIAKKYGCI
jgi:hypothetical protein